MKATMPLTLLTLVILAACSPGEPPAPEIDIDALANEYLFLELSMGLHDQSHVDAYFGPEEIRARAEAAALDLDEILAASTALSETLAGIDASTDEQQQARLAELRARLRALNARIAINKGELLSFDDESRQLFGTAAPDYDAEHFEEILQRIDELLPGEGPLSERVEAFRKQFYVPDDKRAAVFEAALDECRRRTMEWIELPQGESFTIEYVSNKPWSGYNWYQGDAKSLIQVNTDQPASISRAIDLGCHEGYPGHHVYNALLEKNLVEGRGWIEYSLYPLFSPQSLVAEGSANYGVDLVFPADERIAFEKEVLFPLAGLDASQVDRYYELADLAADLAYAGNEAARDYLNGDIDAEQAVDWLVTYGLSTASRARQRISFFDAYRSYVINYNHGKDLVAAYVERGNPTLEERWTRFEKLLSSPARPEDL